MLPSPRTVRGRPRRGAQLRPRERRRTTGSRGDLHFEAEGRPSRVRDLFLRLPTRKPDDHAASGAFKRGARAPRSHEFGGRLARLKGVPNADERAALADCAEPFIHRKKSLPGLRQKNACKQRYLTRSCGIRICRDVFQKGGAAETSS